MKKIIKKIIFFLFIFLIIGILIKVSYIVTIKIKQQKSKNDIYKIINDTYFFAKENKISDAEIFELKENKIVSLFNNYTFNCEKQKYHGYIMLNSNNEVAIQLSTNKYSVIKDFHDIDVTFIDKTDDLIIGGDILSVSHPFLSTIIKQPVKEMFTYPEISLGRLLENHFDINVSLKKGKDEVTTLSTNNIGDKYTIFYDIKNDKKKIKIQKEIKVLVVEDNNAPVLEFKTEKVENGTLVTIDTDVPNIASLNNPLIISQASKTSGSSFLNQNMSENFDVYQFEKSGTSNEWNGFISNIETEIKKDDYLIISGYYKTTSSISAMDAGFTPITDEIKKVDCQSYSKNLSVIADNNWHYYYNILKFNENITNIKYINGWGYANSPGTLYLSRVNVRIVPKEKAKTALDIHIRKYAPGIKDKNYFKDNGILINDNTVFLTEPNNYTIYVEDAKGNATIKTLNNEEES